MGEIEDKLKQYIVVIDDPKHPAMPIIRLKNKPRCRTIDLQRSLAHKNAKILPPGIPPPNCYKSSMSGVQGRRRKVKTPEGIFDTVRAAGEHYNMRPASVQRHCRLWTELEFFYYEETE